MLHSQYLHYIQPMNPPSSLTREISPPLVRNTSRSSTTQAIHRNDCSPKSRPSLAAIEAGQARIRDHLSYFASHLQRAARPSVLDTPRLSIPDLQSLYQRNENSRGRHFVVHQHDHPISGTLKAGLIRPRGSAWLFG